MGNRLSKIYTRTGDNGTTALANGKRISKCATVFEVMGHVDELNAHIGMIRALLQANFKHISKIATHLLPGALDILDQLSKIQHLLFNIGGELAMPEFEAVDTQHIEWLEQKIDAMNAHLPALKDFILPAGSQTIAQVHIARSVCRRAERSAVALGSQPRPNTLIYLNRLSDYLFVLARHCAKLEGIEEVLWDKAVLE